MRRCADGAQGPTGASGHRFSRRAHFSTAQLVMLALLLSALNSTTARPVPTSTAASPLSRLSVYVSAGSPFPEGVAALRASDGHVGWRYTTTVAVSLQESGDGSVVYAVAGDGLVLAPRAADGMLLWRRQLDEPSRIAPGVGDGLVYVTTTLSAEQRPAIYALAADDGSMRWRFPTGPEGGFSSSPVIARRRLHRRGLRDRSGAGRLSLEVVPKPRVERPQIQPQPGRGA